jgi:hypothetical protein
MFKVAVSRQVVVLRCWCWLILYRHLPPEIGGRSLARLPLRSCSWPSVELDLWGDGPGGESGQSDGLEADVEATAVSSLLDCGLVSRERNPQYGLEPDQW